MFKRSLILVVFLFFFLFLSFAYADFSRPKVGFSQTFRKDLNNNANKILIANFSLGADYLSKDNAPLFKLTAFSQTRRDIERDDTVRQELGLELGKDFCPWFYMGVNAKYVWLHEDFQTEGVYKHSQGVELEPHFIFSNRLFSFKDLKVNWLIEDEMTYDLEFGLTKHNEAIFGFIIPIGKHFKTQIDWRHIDRLHYYDSDIFEAGLNFNF